MFENSVSKDMREKKIKTTTTTTTTTTMIKGEIEHIF
jgi:hypothetical protein